MLSIFNGRERKLGDEPRDSYYVQLDVGFRDYLNQFKGAKLAVFLEIALHTDEMGWSFPSIARICKKTGYNRSTVQKAIVELCKLELDGNRVLLKKQARQGGKKFDNNCYLVFPTADEVAKYERKDVAAPVLPATKKRATEKPYTENPSPGKPSPENMDTKNNHDKEESREEKPREKDSHEEVDYSLSASAEADADKTPNPPTSAFDSSRLELETGNLSPTGEDYPQCEQASARAVSATTGGGSASAPATASPTSGFQAAGAVAGSAPRDNARQATTAATSRRRNKPKDPLCDHPAVVIFNEFYGWERPLTPPQRRLVAARITDLEAWKRTLEFWAARSSNPYNLERQFEIYDNKEFEKKDGGRKYGNDSNTKSARERACDEALNKYRQYAAAAGHESSEPEDYPGSVDVEFTVLD